MRKSSRNCGESGGRDISTDREVKAVAPETTPQGKNNTKHKGELAELEFILKATKKGFPVAKPYGENQRYDVIVDGGVRRCRIQVKTSSVTCDNGFFVRTHRRTRNKCIPYTPAEIDFIAAVVHEDIWYILPIKALAGRLSLHVYPFGSRKTRTVGEHFEKYREAWSLLRNPRRTRQCKADRIRRA